VAESRWLSGGRPLRQEARIEEILAQRGPGPGLVHIFSAPSKAWVQARVQIDLKDQA